MLTKWVVALLGLGLIVMASGCGIKGRNFTMMDNPIASHRTGGQASSGINYTLSRKASPSLQKLQKDAPPTPANIQAAQNVDGAQIYFFKTNGHVSQVVSSPQEATYLGLQISVISYGPKPLNYEIPIAMVEPGKRVQLKPSAGTPWEYEVYITAADKTLSDFVVDTDVRTSTGDVNPMLTHQAVKPSQQQSQVSATTASRVSPSPATIQFMSGPTNIGDLTADFYKRYPEVAYLNAHFAKPAKIPAVSKETLYGSSITKITIPLSDKGDKKLCIDIQVVETGETTSPTTVSCGADMFGASLIGNNYQGQLLLELDHTSGESFFLSVNMNNAGADSAGPPASAPTNLSSQQLDQKVNAQAFVKVDLSKPRSLLATSYLEDDAENPTTQKIIDTVRDSWWLKSNADLNVVAAFFSTGQTEIQKGIPEFEKLDLPSDMILVSLIESGAFWTNGQIQGGKEISGDCALGPFQIMHGTAADRAADTFPGIPFHFMTNIPVRQGVCVGSAVKGRDDRTDFTKAAMLAAAEMNYLFNYFETMKAPDQKIVDPKLIIAAYNWGEGSITNAISKVVYRKTDNKSQVKSPQTGRRMRASDGNFERFLLTARVYPNFWTLRKMHMLPKETRQYVERWLALRELNQAPAQFGLGIQMASKN